MVTRERLSSTINVLKAYECYMQEDRVLVIKYVDMLVYKSKLLYKRSDMYENYSSPRFF